MWSLWTDESTVDPQGWWLIQVPQVVLGRRHLWTPTAKTVIIARDKLDADIEEKGEPRSDPLKRYKRFKKSRDVWRKKTTVIEELNSLGLLDADHKVDEGDKYILAVVKEADNEKAIITAISKKSSDV